MPVLSPARPRLRGTLAVMLLVAATVLGLVAPFGAASTAQAADPTRQVVMVITTDPNASAMDQATALQIAQTRFDEMAAYWSDISNGTVEFKLEQAPIWDPGYGHCAASGPERNQTFADTRAHSGFTDAPMRYFIVNVVNCTTFAGVGGGWNLTSGGSLYIEDPKWKALWTHEIGHALGMQHANLLACSDGTVDGDIASDPNPNPNCVSRFYGDRYDTMSASPDSIFLGFSAPQAIKNGFYAPDEYYKLTGCQAQDLTIQSRNTEDAPIAIQVTDPISGRDYYVEYVINAEYDAGMPGGASGSNPTIMYGFGVRVLRFAPDNTTLVIPATANAAGERPSFWAPGTTFDSASGGLAVSVVSQTATSATLRVTTPCPTPQDDAQPTAFGQPVQVPVVANDVPVGTSTIDPATVVFPATGQPSGAVVATDGRTLTMPGQGTYVVDPTTGVVTFTPEAAFLGQATPVTYQVAASNTLTGTAAIAVTVNPVAPVAAPDAGSTSSGAPVTLDPLSNDIPSTSAQLVRSSLQLLPTPGAANGTNRVDVPGEGTWEVQQDGTVRFTPAAGFSGTTTPMPYRVLDSANQVAEGALTVTVAPAVAAPSTPPTSTAPVAPAPTAPAPTTPPGSTRTAVHAASAAHVTAAATLPRTAVEPGAAGPLGLLLLALGLSALAVTSRRERLRAGAQR